MGLTSWTIRSFFSVSIFFQGSSQCWAYFCELPPPTPQSHSAAEQQPALLYRAVTPSPAPPPPPSPPPHPSLHQPPVTFQASLADSLGKSSPFASSWPIYFVLPAIKTRAACFSKPFSPECLILACVGSDSRPQRLCGPDSVDLVEKNTARHMQEHTAALGLSVFVWVLFAVYLWALTSCETHSFGFWPGKAPVAPLFSDGATLISVAPFPSLPTVTPSAPLLNLHPASRKFSSYFQWII